MRRKLLLCVSTYHLTAAVWARGQLRSLHEFTDDEAGQRDFMTFLGGLRRIPIYFLADTLDEDYRFEMLPRAKGSDQRELLDRKLKQAYRATPFSAAQLIYRDKQSKRDDHYFFAALTKADGLEPWINLVQARRLPVVGVYLAPLVLNGFIRTLGLDDRNTLAVSQHAAGLRQTFFKNGQYRVSRLTLARPDSFGPSAVNYPEEIRNTRGYLDALNITHVDEPVTVLIMDQDGSLADVESALGETSPKLRVVRLPPEQLADRLRVPVQLLDTYRDALPLQLLGSAEPSINLAPRVVTSGYDRMRASRIIYAAAGAMAAIAVSWLGVNVFRTGALDDEAQGYALHARGEEARYNEIARTFPPTPGSGEHLRQASEAAALLRSSYRTPDAMYKVISQALDQSPSIVLQSMTWRHGPAIPPPGQTSVTPGPANFTQSAKLSAQLVAAEADYRGIISRVDQFVQLLASHPSVASAKATNLPVSTASTSALTGDTSVAREEKPAPPIFEVEVVLKPGL